MKSKIANHLIGWSIAIILVLFIIVAFRACATKKDDPGAGSAPTKNYGSPRYAKKIITPIENGVRLQTPCRGVDEVGLLPAGKNAVEILHRRSSLTRGNRCSQSFDEPIELSGWQVEKEWRNELTLPVKPPGNSFVLRNKSGKIVAWTNISTGGKAYLRRPSGEDGELQIEHFANIVANINSMQIGWDGSFATFEFRW